MNRWKRDTTERRGRAITNANAANERTGTCDIYTRRCPLSYTSSSDSHTVPSLSRGDKYSGACEHRVAKGEINYRPHIMKYHHSVLFPSQLKICMT